MRILFLASLLFIPAPSFAGLSLPEKPSAIWKGEAVTHPSGYWRHTVLLSSTFGTCSGVIVSDDLVLTAAHCLAQKPDTIHFFSAANIQADIRPVSTAAAHPRYAESAHSGHDFDLAVVRFPGGLPDHFAPASILENENSLGAKDKLLAVGFGLTSPLDPPKKSPGLFFASMRLNRFHRGDYLTFVALGDDQGACPGDSGGPVFLETADGPVLAGLIARKLGSPTCVDSPATIAIALPYFLPWIREMDQNSR